MLTRTALVWSLCLLGFVAGRTLAQEALLSPRDGELLVGPITVQQNLSGVPLTSRVVSFLSAEAAEEGVEIRLRSIADLSDLQAKFGRLVDTLPLPSDNCKRFAVDNLVVRIWGKKLQALADGAEVELAGEVDVWTCVKNPVPCSKVEWKVEDVGLGIKTKVPVVTTWDCNPPIKTRNLRQPFTARLPLQLTVPDSQSIGLKILQPTVDLEGSQARITDGILEIAGIDLSRLLQRQLDRAVDEAIFRPSIPEEIRRLEPSIISASLFDNGGTLAASVEMKARAGGSALSDLLTLLVSR